MMLRTAAYFLNRLVQPGDIHSILGAAHHKWRVIHGDETIVDIVEERLQVTFPTRFITDQIPFVHRDYARFVRLADHACDLFVHRRDTLRGVDDETAKIRALDAFLGTHDAEDLD